MAKRFITRVELTVAARDQLTALCESKGMTQVAVFSRLVQWFAAQPEIIQAGILGHYPPELQVDIARLILARMTANSSAVSTSTIGRPSSAIKAHPTK
jgi:hypothetical protein